MVSDKAIQEAAEKLRADYQACFLGGSGHRVLSDLARVGFLAESTHVPGDAYHSAFREGARAVVLHIFAACDMLSLDKWLDQFGAKKAKKK